MKELLRIVYGLFATFIINEKDADGGVPILDTFNNPHMEVYRGNERSEPFQLPNDPSS